MLLVELPLFARAGLGVGLGGTTLMASGQIRTSSHSSPAASLPPVPFLANWLFSLGYSRALDTLVAQVGDVPTTTCSQGRLTRLAGRKVSVGVAGLGPAACLLAIILAGDNVPLVIALTTLAVMLYGRCTRHHLNLSPSFPACFPACSPTTRTSRPTSPGR